MRARILLAVWLAATSVLAQSSSAKVAAAGLAAASDPAAEVLAFEREMEAAVVRGDVAFLDRVCASDFSFTHGDGWTTGGAPLRVENKAQWLAAVAKAPYLFRNLDSVKVELHGDIAITYGRYQARFKTGEPGHREFIVWFERVYARRGAQWQYVSHRTVHGPDYLSEPAIATP